LDSLFASLAEAGATGVTAGALYLKPGTREWFMQWIAARHPELVGRYRRLYGAGSYASKEYRTWLAGRVRFFKARHGLAGSHGFSHRDVDIHQADSPRPDDPRGEEAAYPVGSLPQHGSPRQGTGQHGGVRTSQPTLF
ncbi:MAG TPA: radical SAM protein, partial [Arthrobacter sp.]|nr:radical SAM protein [Arthrobacter sp.]